MNHSHPTMTLRVRCIVEVDVEVPADADPEFQIEKNSCPGTGPVGSAIEREMAHHEEAATCWGCAAHGVNEIIAVNGMPVRKPMTDTASQARRDRAAELVALVRSVIPSGHEHCQPEECNFSKALAVGGYGTPEKT